MTPPGSRRGWLAGVVFGLETIFMSQGLRTRNLQARAFGGGVCVMPGAFVG
jgi:hypothetical protein